MAFPMPTPFISGKEETYKGGNSAALKTFLEELHKEIFSRLEEKFLNIDTYFQPIFSHLNGNLKIIGYEALSRPQNGTPILKLFDEAKARGILPEFDLFCRIKALLKAFQLGFRGEVFLFLNVHPYILDKKPYPTGITKRLLHLLDIPLERVVLEITEFEQPKDNDTFLKTLFHFQGQGYKLSLDDFGAGCLSFKTLLEIKPDFLKLDKFLTQTLNFDETSQKIVGYLRELCEDLGIGLIAEGVEDRATLEWLETLKIPYCQGFYLGKPSPNLEVRRWEPLVPQPLMFLIF